MFSINSEADASEFIESIEKYFLNSTCIYIEQVPILKTQKVC